MEHDGCFYHELVKVRDYACKAAGLDPVIAGWKTAVDAMTKQLADAQATVEALQRERDEAIEAASLPTWVCDGCGRVSSDGWINRVTESLDGTDYEMECPVCGVRAIEEDCASDLVRERDDLQAALDAEREKVARLDAMYRQQLGDRDKRIDALAGSAKIWMDKLSQLQALVRAYLEARKSIDSDLAEQARENLKRTLDATTPAVCRLPRL